MILRRALDGHFYLRGRILGGDILITYQITSLGVELLAEVGITEDRELPRRLVRFLFDEGLIYTYGTGVTTPTKPFPESMQNKARDSKDGRAERVLFTMRKILSGEDVAWPQGSTAGSSPGQAGLRPEHISAVNQEEGPAQDTPVNAAKASSPMSRGRDLFGTDLLTLWPDYGFYMDCASRVKHFISNGDGTVTDSTTRLIWQQAGSASLMDWYAAAGYVKSLNHQKFAGYSDWRVPTLRELGKLREGCPHLNPALPEIRSGAGAAIPLARNWPGVSFSQMAGPTLF